MLVVSIWGYVAIWWKWKIADYCFWEMGNTEGKKQIHHINWFEMCQSGRKFNFPNQCINPMPDWRVKNVFGNVIWTRSYSLYIDGLLVVQLRSESNVTIMKYCVYSLLFVLLTTGGLHNVQCCFIWGNCCRYNNA